MMITIRTMLMLSLGILGFLLFLLVFLVVFGVLAALICKKIVQDPDDENERF